MTRWDFAIDMCCQKSKWACVFELENELNSGVEYFNICKECATDSWQYVKGFDDSNSFFWGGGNTAINPDKKK